MKLVSKEKFENLEQIANEDGVIAALAIDQRGSMEKMISAFDPKMNNVEDLSRFKKLVSENLTKYASSILLDPIYGMTAVPARDKNAGLLMSYEVTGYDNTEVGRLPILISGMSGLRIKEMGSNAIKILLYYDVDESDEINDQKKAFVERVGYEAEGLGLPFFLEIVSYDYRDEDTKTVAYAKARPHKVIDAMKVFDDPRYKVDVLKVEAPVNMKYVEGFAEGEIVYSRKEALDYFKAQSEAISLPFIFLSGGVSADLFKETLRFAKEAGSEFNGVLCGRATRKGAVEEFAKGDQEALTRLESQGRENIESLNEVLKETATPFTTRIKAE